MEEHGKIIIYKDWYSRIYNKNKTENLKFSVFIFVPYDSL